MAQYTVATYLESQRFQTKWKNCPFLLLSISFIFVQVTGILSSWRVSYNELFASIS